MRGKGGGVNQRYGVGILFVLGLFASASRVAAFSDPVQDARNLGIQMVRDIRIAIKSRYFDPQFRGLDVDALFARAETRVREASTEAQMGFILAQTLGEFRDSHTYFIPPVRPFDIDYGFELRIVGDAPLVIEVDKGSDAEKKGLLPGDRLLTVDGTAATRGNFMAVSYALNVALPRRQLELKVQTDNEPPRSMTVLASIEQRRKRIDITEWFDEMMDRMRRRPQYAWRYWTYEKERVVVAKFYTFMVTDELVNDLMSKIHDARALVLDLRGNPGGSIEALQTAAGAFFEQEIELASQKERKSTKVLRSRRPKSKRLFSGTLIVLVDSASASSAELLARVVQLEKRGTVVGDQTAGAVMLAQHVSLTAGNQIRFILYGASVTVADLVMKDGRSLEGFGVTPDEIVRPTAADIRLGRDPAMARAAKLAGLDLSPEAAWSHFRPRSEPEPKPKGDAPRP